MCGIVGYVGPREAQPLILEGLRRLEYRGYDSAGIATIHDGALDVRKAAGKIVELEGRLEEARAHGFRRAIVGLHEARKAPRVSGMEIVAVQSVRDAVTAAFENARGARG